MKVAGIIAEYNPLHSGHLYQMEKTRELTGADYIVVAMSGSYTQRGIPAFFDKYLRTEMALACGADLILELPVSVSTGSGEYFSKGAVTLLNSLGVVDYLSFGSESGKIDDLKTASEILLNEPKEFSEQVKKYMSSGSTYPQAISKAAEEFNPSIAKTLSSPNNTLGIEYLKALKMLNSSIEPITITRIGSGYNDTSISGSHPSATALRNMVENNRFEDFIELVPENARDILTKHALDKSPVYMCANDFSAVVINKLLYTSDYTLYGDINRDFSNRIGKTISKSNISFDELAEALKSKEITKARVQRSLFQILLDISKKDLAEIKRQTTSPYIRILGMKESASPLLKEIRKKASSPIITRPAREGKELSGFAKRSYDADSKAYMLYSAVMHNKYYNTTYKPREDYRGMLIYL